MSFEYLRIKDGDPIKETEEYKKAFEVGGNVPLTSRVADRDQGAALYCVSVGGGPDNEWPGRYLFIYKNQLIDIEALLARKWVDGVGRVATYRVSKLNVPDRLQTDRRQIIELLKGAFDVEGKNYPVPPSVVNVEID